MGKRVVKPAEGARVEFIPWPTDTEWLKGTVMSLLDQQFTVLTDDARTYYVFYVDYGTQWKLVKQ